MTLDNVLGKCSAFLFFVLLSAMNLQLLCYRSVCSSFMSSSFTNCFLSRVLWQKLVRFKCFTNNTLFVLSLKECRLVNI